MKTSVMTNLTESADTTRKLLISPAEACELLGIGKTTMYKLIHEGIIPVIKLPHCRRLYISVEALNQMIKENIVTSPVNIGGEI